ncbi:hypothetical protein [Companilactobacillus hulinensis]|uniref:hypothetical protein n=1 Tax=Companilactobacillus hulinensis TaxID=2486007 RepID=UPI000F78EA2E|nr:hypothetical protein [Companilactobacillus hulinensis]
MEFNAYHGTSYEIANKIKNERKFIYHERPGHWLGNGVYFFMEDPDAAKWWARSKFKSDSAVLKFLMNIDSKYILNLSSLSGANEFVEFKKYIKSANLDYGYSDEDVKYLNSHPGEEANVQRSKLIELLCRSAGYKACFCAFKVPNNRLKITELDFVPQEIQVNILEPSLINFDTLELEHV